MSRPLQPHTILHGSSSTLRFFLGDCLDVLPRLEPGSLDIVITSPPYNLGVAYRSYDDRRPRSDYLGWTGQWVKEVAQALRPQGSLFLNVGSKPTDPWTAFDVAQAARPHLRLQNVFHWIKSIAVERDLAGAATGLRRDLAIGHYKPINSKRFVNDCHEFVFHFTPTGETPLDRLALGVPYQDQSNVARWETARGGIRCRGNTWFLPYDTIQDRDKDRPHPATFPPRLPEYCLKLHGASAGSVAADPFLGLGSTAVAAAMLGVDFVGIELDANYLEEAIARTRVALEGARAVAPRTRRSATT